MSDPYKEFIDKQRQQDEMRQYISRKVQESDGHDRNTCDCIGCMFWWQLNVVFERGFFMEIFPNVKFMIREKGLDLYLRDYMLSVRRIATSGGRPLWIAYASNKGLVKREL